ncbi:major facilitator transporter [Pseudonocardia sp. EC080610-09]|uniref:MFS transporter n=1 Tax=unclassified Pseudonocardia TaxID=2619320 RepID=UPI000706E12A|nr:MULTISPECIES: aromatic acid/H+ symport family MFS transporter [unclassified Pseudonocardia]ALL75727.1 major facilitator transporter [Pseudonocardia sp. EC080610-09]ALL82754.1 major facilitator transporter [Pseudonocardia sp. EC080619-01]
MTNASRSGDATGTTGRAGRGGWVAPLCWSAVALEGFDLVVLGVVLPSLLDEPSWGLTPATASLVSTAGLLGVMVGALSAGPLADLLGRRRAMLATVVSFSVLTLLCAVATGPWTFGALRFLAGLGLGGVLPVALAMVNEHSRSGRGGSATTVLMTGYHVGAVATSLLGILVIPFWGWRPMFVLGALPALVLVPLLARFLPDSRPVPQAATPAAAPRARNPIAQLVRDGYLRSSVAFWVASFMGLLLVYGLNTWLPQIMRVAGYGLDAALAQLLVLNVGAIAGLLVAGRVADRIGVRPATPAWFAAAALFLALLAIPLPGIGIYVSVLLAGVFVFSAQVLVYAYVSQHYPDHARASALGAASGIGRLGAISGPLLGGALLTAGIAYPWGFFAFAAVAALGGVAVLAVGRSRPADAH